MASRYRHGNRELFRSQEQSRTAGKFRLDRRRTKSKRQEHSLRLKYQPCVALCFKEHAIKAIAHRVPIWVDYMVSNAEVVENVITNLHSPKWKYPTWNVNLIRRRDERTAGEVVNRALPRTVLLNRTRDARKDWRGSPHRGGGGCLRLLIRLSAETGLRVRQPRQTKNRETAWINESPHVATLL